MSFQPGDQILQICHRTVDFYRIGATKSIILEGENKNIQGNCISSACESVYCESYYFYCEKPVCMRCRVTQFAREGVGLCPFRVHA